MPPIPAGCLMRRNAHARATLWSPESNCASVPIFERFGPVASKRCTGGTLITVTHIVFNSFRVMLLPALPTGPHRSSSISINAPDKVPAMYSVPSPSAGSNRVLFLLLKCSGGHGLPVPAFSE